MRLVAAVDWDVENKSWSSSGGKEYSTKQVMYPGVYTMLHRTSHPIIRYGGYSCLHGTEYCQFHYFHEQWQLSHNYYRQTGSIVVTGT